MPFDDEPTPYSNAFQPSDELTELTRRVIGAAIEVHSELGPGLPEEAYQAALALEFDARHIPYQAQFPVVIHYKGVPVCRGKLDFLVGHQLIVEIKACELLAPIHTKQVLAYLAQTKLHLGLLINFNVPVLKDGIRRIIRS